MRTKSLIAALGAASALLATEASAQAYLGASLGQSRIDESIAEGLITSGQVDGKDSAFKIFGGFRLHRHFALELAYVNLGEASYSGEFFGAPVTGGKVKASGFSVSAVGLLPLTEQFSVFGKVGLFAWEAKASDVTGGFPFSATQDGSDVSFGLGASYDFTARFSVRAEWERFNVVDSDVDLLSVGLQYRF